MTDSDIASFTYTIISLPGGGGGGGGSSPPAIISASGSAFINAGAGGMVGLGAEATVKIPAYALKGNGEVKIELSRIDTPPAIPSGFMVLGATYEFKVGDNDSYQFDKAVTLTFTFDPDKVPPGQTPAVNYYDQNQGKWVNLGGTISGNTISIDVSHFTKFAVMIKEAAKQDLPVLDFP